MNEFEDLEKAFDNLLNEFPEKKHEFVRGTGEEMKAEVDSNVATLGTKTGNLAQGVTLVTRKGYAAVRANHKIAPHTHLLENGHVDKNGRHIKGRHMYRNALMTLEDSIYAKAEELMDSIGGDF